MKKSQEDYLESIFRLSKNQEYVRSIDIVRDLSFSKPSVSIAMKKLKSDLLIEINELGHITLTKKGLEIASSINERHEFFFEFLVKIGVSEEIAREDACNLEHVISQETFIKLKNYLK